MPQLLLLPVQSIGGLPPLQLLWFATCVLEMVRTIIRINLLKKKKKAFWGSVETHVFQYIMDSEFFQL